MKTVTMFFDKGLIKLNLPKQNGTEYMSFEETKTPVCAMVDIPTNSSELKLDFEAELVEYVLGGVRTCKSLPGLAEMEGPIFSLLGYEETDMTNVVGLVEAFINGKMSEDLFQFLFAFEEEKNTPNPGIAQFLKALEHDEADREEDGHA